MSHIKFKTLEKIIPDPEIPKPVELVLKSHIAGCNTNWRLLAGETCKYSQATVQVMA